MILFISGTLAHLGERTTEDRKVRGSSSRSPKIFFRFFMSFIFDFSESTPDDDPNHAIFSTKPQFFENYYNISKPHNFITQNNTKPYLRDNYNFNHANLNPSSSIFSNSQNIPNSKLFSETQTYNFNSTQYPSLKEQSNDFPQNINDMRITRIRNNLSQNKFTNTNNNSTNNLQQSNDTTCLKIPNQSFQSQPPTVNFASNSDYYDNHMVTIPVHYQNFDSVSDSKNYNINFHPQASLDTQPTKIDLSNVFISSALSPSSRHNFFTSDNNQIPQSNFLDNRNGETNSTNSNTKDGTNVVLSKPSYASQFSNLIISNTSTYNTNDKDKSSYDSFPEASHQHQDPNEFLSKPSYTSQFSNSFNSYTFTDITNNKDKSTNDSFPEASHQHYDSTELVAKPSNASQFSNSFNPYTFTDITNSNDKSTNDSFPEASHQHYDSTELVAKPLNAPQYTNSTISNSPKNKIRSSRTLDESEDIPFFMKVKLGLAPDPDINVDENDDVLKPNNKLDDFQSRMERCTYGYKNGNCNVSFWRTHYQLCLQNDIRMSARPNSLSYLDPISCNKWNLLKLGWSRSELDDLSFCEKIKLGIAADPDSPSDVEDDGMIITRNISSPDFFPTSAQIFNYKRGFNDITLVHSKHTRKRLFSIVDSIKDSGRLVTTSSINNPINTC